MNALNRVSTRPDPFSTFEYLENFARHESPPPGRRLTIWLLTASHNGRLVGYLALKRVTHKVMGLLNVSTLGFLVTHDTDRPHLVASPEYESVASEAFYGYLLARKREWSLLEFHQQDDRSPLFPPPTAVDLTGYRVSQWPCLENCTLRIRWRTLNEYFNALPKKSRSNLSRQIRGLHAAGTVEWLASSDPSVTSALFELYRSVERRSWKAQAGADLGRHPHRVAYLISLLDAGQPMRVSIQILLLDEIPIAALICGEFMQGMYALHIAYDERLYRFAPGSAILLMTVRQAIAGQHAFLNLLSGFGYYKTRWLADVAPTRVAQIYRVGSFLFWRRVIGDWKRRIWPSPANDSPTHFNSARRDVRKRIDEPQATNGASKLEVGGGERRRIAALLAEVRRGSVESLSATQLTSEMPFVAIEPQQIAGQDLKMRRSVVATEFE